MVIFHVLRSLWGYLKGLEDKRLVVGPLMVWEELMYPPAKRANLELSQRHSNDGKQKDSQSKEKEMFQ